MQQRTPPIFFTDMAWKRGRRLVDFKISEPAEMSGQSVVCSAELSLQDESGSPQKKNARYLIDIGQAIVIVPGDM